MKKVLVFTGADEKMKDVFNLTIPSKLNYAKKWNYDFLLINSFKVYSQYGMDDRHIGFSRFLHAMELLSHYDYVMWIDGDSIITNDSYNINDFVKGEENFFFSYDWFTGPGHNHICFSSGNFILKSSEDNEFLRKSFLDISQNQLNSDVQEQGVLNDMFSLPEFTKYFKILEHKYLNSVPNYVSETGIWQGRPSITFPWNENSFLAHFTGITNLDRVDIITNNFQKFLL
jgi:hypothetical protein